MKTKANLGEILKEQGKLQTEFANEIDYDDVNSIYLENKEERRTEAFQPMYVLLNCHYAMGFRVRE